MDRPKPFTEQIRDWYQHNPKAQQAVRRLSADLDRVAERVDTATSGLQKAVAPYIDPPPAVAPPADQSADTAASAELDPSAAADPRVHHPDASDS